MMFSANMSRPRLVADPQRIAKAARGDQQQRSPLRSSSALVATVVPILTLSTRPSGIVASGSSAEQAADACERGVVDSAGIFGQQFLDMQATGRIATDHIRERAAAIDPEIPCGGIVWCAASFAMPIRDMAASIGQGAVIASEAKRWRRRLKLKRLNRPSSTTAAIVRVHAANDSLDLPAVAVALDFIHVPRSAVALEPGTADAEATPTIGTGPFGPAICATEWRWLWPWMISSAPCLPDQLLKRLASDSPRPGEAPLPLRRMVDHHHAHQPARAGFSQRDFEPVALLRAELAGGQQRRRRHARIDADQRDARRAPADRDRASARSHRRASMARTSGRDARSDERT